MMKKKGRPWPEPMEIVKWPDPRLRDVSAPVKDDEFEYYKDNDFIERMVATMYSAGGIGLSAIQVGCAKRIVVMDAGRSVAILINPQIVKLGGTKVLMDEGCLSLPGIYEKVKRHPEAVVKAWNVHKQEFTMTLVGQDAQCIQHELEHLDGKFFLDHVAAFKRERIRKRLEKK